MQDTKIRIVNNTGEDQTVSIFGKRPNAEDPTSATAWAMFKLGKGGRAAVELPWRMEVAAGPVWRDDIGVVSVIQSTQPGMHWIYRLDQDDFLELRQVGGEESRNRIGISNQSREEAWMGIARAGRPFLVVPSVGRNETVIFEISDTIYLGCTPRASQGMLLASSAEMKAIVGIDVANAQVVDASLEIAEPSPEAPEPTLKWTIKVNGKMVES